MVVQSDNATESDQDRRVAALDQPPELRVDLVDAAALAPRRCTALLLQALRSVLNLGDAAAPEGGGEGGVGDVVRRPVLGERVPVREG